MNEFRLESAEGALRCCTCNRLKPPDEFYNQRARRTGKSAACKACQQVEQRRQESLTPGVSYRRHLRRKYGITPDDYDALMKEQGHCCAICGTDQPGGNGNRTFQVDHDHLTGVVRGLLCADCNQGLARFHDDPFLMNRAIWYLDDLRMYGPAPDRLTPEDRGRLL